MASRFQNAFPSDAAKAFGKHIKVQKTNEFPKAAENAFRSVRNEDSSRLKQTNPIPNAFETKRENPAFTDSALNAFGKIHSDLNEQAFQSQGKGKNNNKSHENFNEDAMHAFGKKASKRVSESHEPSDTTSSTGEWQGSALRSITKEKAKEKPELNIDAVSDFPVLGSKKEDAFPPLGSNKSKTSSAKSASPNVSFANLVKKRAEEDAKEADELARVEAKRQAAAKKKQEEADRAKKARSLYLENKRRIQRNEAEFEEKDAADNVSDDGEADADEGNDEDNDNDDDNVYTNTNSKAEEDEHDDNY
jgi:hypothetical protein